MILHRYFEAKFGLLLLENLELKVATPGEFNDPFEFRPIDITKWTYTNIDKYYKRDTQRVEEYKVHCKELNLSFSNTWKTFIRGMVKKSQNGFPEQMFKEMKIYSDSIFRFICFSSLESTSDQNQILMWSHYADKHTGLRVHFDSEKFTKNETQTKPVEYGKRVPFNILLDRQSEEFKKQMHDLLLTKSEAWRYEEEYRMIVDQNRCKEKDGLWFYKILPEKYCPY
jgi:hypothetical protein